MCSEGLVEYTAVVTYHLEGPHSSDPDFQLAFNTFDALQVDAFPPAPPGWLPPEEQQLLCHADGVRSAGSITLDVGS